MEIEYCGNYRDDAVFLRTSSYIPPDAVEIPNLIVELCCYYNDFNIESQTRFENIIETYYRFEKIHPFFDGNGRTGRLLMNYLLILNGYSFLWINSELRSEYLASFEDNRLCLDFHADRMLEIYQALKQRRMEEKI